MAGPRFLGLSTGRAGSRYFARLLNEAGIKTLHEQTDTLSKWFSDAVGEVSAHFVTQMEAWPFALIWHFSRHPQPFATSMIKFGFWNQHAPHIHPFVRREGDRIEDSFRFWVDWNRRIMDGALVPRRTTFRIEDLDRHLLDHLGRQIGVQARIEKVNPVWDEKQEFAPIPDSVREEVLEMMEILGYEPQ